jgi:hypothetical protein
MGLVHHDDPAAPEADVDQLLGGAPGDIGQCRLLNAQLINAAR